MASSSFDDLSCFHSMPIAKAKSVPFAASARHSSVSWKPSNRWLEKQIGFYPHFLSLGNVWAIENTFYARWCTDETWQSKNLLARFSLEALNTVVFADYLVWMYGGGWGQIADGKEPGPKWRRELLKPSWSAAEWCRLAREHFDRVMILVPVLDLTKADQIWVQDPVFLSQLATAGLKHVIVKPLCKGSEDVDLADSQSPAA